MTCIDGTESCDSGRYCPKDSFEFEYSPDTSVFGSDSVYFLSCSSGIMVNSFSHIIDSTGRVCESDETIGMPD